MDDGPWTMYLCLVLGCVGSAYFVYGKKQQHWVALACGIGIIVAPLVISVTWAAIAVSLVLMAIPFAVRR